MCLLIEPVKFNSTDGTQLEIQPWLLLEKMIEKKGIYTEI